MLRLKIRSHTQKRYAVLRTTEYTFRKDVYLYWNFGLLIYYPQKTTSVKRPLGAFYSSNNTRFQVGIFRFLQSKFIY